MRILTRGRMPLNQADGLGRGPAVTITVDGAPVTAYAGETVAAVLITQQGMRTRQTVGGASRGVFCGMGVCFDCLAVVDGVPNTRSCMTPVAEGLRVERQQGAGLSR
jgi:D-hydroxyproline dehydrogenase subunit gamma